MERETLGRISSERRPDTVLVVAPQPFYEDRGTPIAVRQVIEALTSLGYGVDLLTYPLGRDVDLPGLRIFRTANPLRLSRVPVGLSWRKLVLDAALVAALPGRLRRTRYACIHAVEEAAFPATLLGRRFGVPVIYDMQSSIPEQLRTARILASGPTQGALHAAERWLLSRADAVVCSMGLGGYVRSVAPDAHVSEWRFASRPVDVPPHEVAVLRAELGLAPDAPVVLYSGTLAPYQGIDQLIEAVPRVRAEHPDAAFVVVGGDERSALGPGVRELVAGGALRLVPRQPRERIAVFLALADVLVSTRAYGGNVPLKIFDYLAAGRPIVATDIETHRSVLTDDFAFLVPPGADGLAGAVCHLLSNPAEAEALGRAALCYAEEHLTRQKFVAFVERLYEEVCRDEPTRSGAADRPSGVPSALHAR